MAIKPAPAAVSFREIYLPAFDGVRGMIALSITLAHSMRAVGWWPNHEFPSALRSSWFFSIEFLFLLGGFVAFLPLLHFGRFSARSFAMRRAGRILPLYYVTLLAAVLLGSELREVTLVSDPHHVGAVLAHLVFLQHLVYPFESGFGVHGIVWTMTIVVCFWLLYPVIARPYARHPFIGLAAAIALMVAWRLAFSGESRIALQFPLFAADFAIGMTAAWCYLRLRPRLRERPRPGLALGIGGAALLCMWTLLYLAGSAVLRKEYGYWGEGPVLAVLVPAAFGIALICLPFVPRAVQRVFDNRPARFIGDISYGLFLFHFLVIWGTLALVDIPRNGSPSSLFELLAIVLPVTIVLAWLGTNLVELPVRERAKLLAARRRTGAPEAPSAQAAAGSSERRRLAGAAPAATNSGGAIAR